MRVTAMESGDKDRLNAIGRELKAVEARLEDAETLSGAARESAWRGIQSDLRMLRVELDALESQSRSRG